MKSKIIIHNESNVSDADALLYIEKCFNRILKCVYFEFSDGIKIQFYQQKTCKTFYIYGEVDNAE